MKTLDDLINETLQHITEIFPWDLEEKLTADTKPLIVDVREAHEFDAMHIEHSIFVPRGILETACEYNYSETIPELVRARDKEVVVVCRSGRRSAMAAFTMQLLGYQNVSSLKTGIRGWNDYDQSLVDSRGRQVDADDAEDFLTDEVSDEQMAPQ